MTTWSEWTQKNHTFSIVCSVRQIQLNKFSTKTSTISYIMLSKDTMQQSLHTVRPVLARPSRYEVMMKNLVLFSWLLKICSNGLIIGKSKNKKVLKQIALTRESSTGKSTQKTPVGNASVIHTMEFSKEMQRWVLATWKYTMKAWMIYWTAIRRI